MQNQRKEESERAISREIQRDRKGDEYIIQLNEL